MRGEALLCLLASRCQGQHGSGRQDPTSSVHATGRLGINFPQKIIFKSGLKLN